MASSRVKRIVSKGSMRVYHDFLGYFPRWPLNFLFKFLGTALFFLLDLSESDYASGGTTHYSHRAAKLQRPCIIYQAKVE